MKMKSAIAVLVGVMMAASSFGQGTVIFSSGSGKRVLDGETGMNADSGVAIAGLYYNVNTAAVPDASIANDGWLLAGTAVVSANPNLPTLDGTFSGGTLTIDGTSTGQQLAFQVRAWSVGFASYEAAFNGGAKVGASAEKFTLALGGGTTAPPNTSGAAWTSFAITVVPEPSTVVLGLLGGLGAMVLLRRRS